jgi:4-hydroxybenzoate polyprenyltransferase
MAAGIHLAACAFLAAVIRTVGGDPLAWLVLAMVTLFFGLMYVPAIPVPKRFFPISTLAGIAGALAPMVA